MEKARSAIKAGDAFAFIDKAISTLTPSNSGQSRPAHQRMLLGAVIDQVNLVDLPLKRLRDGHSWRIDASKLSHLHAMHELTVRVRLAWFHGVDVSERFKIDTKLVHERATRMAEIANSSRTTNPYLNTIPGYEKEVAFTGVPGPNVIHLARWFRRALTKHFRQVADYFALLTSAIGRNASPIVSESVLESRKVQILWQAAFAKSHHLVTTSDGGEKLFAKFSDPEGDAWRRASKNYVRLKGLDDFCEKSGLIGFFVTITLPAKFHPNPANGNCSWDGSTPVDAHKRLQEQWRKFQRRFGETGQKVYGVRVEEPHDDACPHWHALIYVEPAREDVFHAQIQAAFGTGFSTKVVRIDRTLSTGASYLTKYLNPRYAEGEGVSAMDNPKAAKAARYDAYRASWGSRSIQFFDLPGSSSIWDELRRIKAASSQFALLSAEGQTLHSYATAEPPDYGEFLLLLQRMNADKAQRVHVLYAKSEAGSRLLVGLFVDGQRIETHQQAWTVEPVVEKPDAPKKARTVSHSYPSNAGNPKEVLGMETGVEMS